MKFLILFTCLKCFVDVENLLLDKNLPSISKNDVLGMFTLKYKLSHQESIITRNLYFVLYKSIVPKTVFNFIGFAKGFSYKNQVLSYSGTKIHRIVKNFVVQGGDVLNNNGTGSISIYGNTFEDENFKLRHHKGSLSMANRGVHTNGSQFFICNGNITHLNGKHVVFGHILNGESVLNELNNIETVMDIPLHDVIIENVEIYGTNRTIKLIELINKNREL